MLEVKAFRAVFHPSKPGDSEFPDKLRVGINLFSGNVSASFDTNRFNDPAGGELL